VTLAADARVSDRDIIDFCRQKPAHFKAPVAVDFGPLPKTSTGKVLKNVLREREWAGRSSAIN
jgi:fatty-acyl-CoA synthase